VLRHPVQIYESLCMTGMALGCIHWMKRDRQGYMRYSFPCVVLYYAGQRFMWEFLKPYRAVAGTFNLFHFLCLFLAVYSLVLIVRRRSLV
jgi:phosphatidylglycerol:prolipoprotein diacylglycerol transferase